MDYPAGRPQRRQGHEQGNGGLLRKTTKPHAQRRGEDNALTQGGDTEEGGPRARHTQSSAERTRRPICALTTRTGKHRGASTKPHLRGHMCRACMCIYGRSYTYPKHLSEQGDTALGQWPVSVARHTPPETLSLAFLPPSPPHALSQCLSLPFCLSLFQSPPPPLSCPGSLPLPLLVFSPSFLSLRVTSLRLTSPT